MLWKFVTRIYQSSNDLGPEVFHCFIPPADVTVRNANGSTPLHLATDPEIASMLLDAAADPNAVDQVGNSPVGFLCLALQATHF